MGPRSACRAAWPARQGVGGLSQMLVKSQPWMSVEKLAVPAVALRTRVLAYWVICPLISGTIAASFMASVPAWRHSAAAAAGLAVLSAWVIRASTAAEW